MFLFRLSIFTISLLLLSLLSLDALTHKFPRMPLTRHPVKQFVKKNPFAKYRKSHNGSHTPLGRGKDHLLESYSRLRLAGNEDSDPSDRTQSCASRDPSGFLFYLRIGKAGSSSLKRWMTVYRLSLSLLFLFPLIFYSHRSAYTAVRSSIWKDMESVLSFEQEEKLIRSVESLRDGHSTHFLFEFYCAQNGAGGNIPSHWTSQFFLSFPSLSLSLLFMFSVIQPSVLTMLRDPASRYVSQYYYWRTLKKEFGERLRQEGIPWKYCNFDEILYLSHFSLNPINWGIPLSDCLLPENIQCCFLFSFLSQF